MRPGTDLLKEGLILADGATGTYYAQLAGVGALPCELANLENPGLIQRIHQEYLAAGARLLRTNTFAAAAQFGPEDPALLSDVVRAAWRIATDCAGELAFVAADIGPVYNLESEAGRAASQIVLDTFISLGASVFIFETFADPDDFLDFCCQIKTQVENSVIIASFALNADGYTRKGIALPQLASQMEAAADIDIWGFNCGIGPTHLAEQAARLAETGKPLTLMPNSGYPRQENMRLVFDSSPDYFAQAAASLPDSRVRLLGGCCGTTPQHIRALRALLDRPDRPASVIPHSGTAMTGGKVVPSFGRLADKLVRSEFVIVCELDPPRTSQTDALIAGARQLQLAGFDAVTLADSPLARVKMDPVTCAARISRETGLPAMPHLCCRDRNVNALRSTLLAAHAEGIRQVLAVTGDGIPESDKGFIKPVFNVSSLGLLQLISQMNQDEFAGDPMLPAAALDPGVANPQVELARTLKKRDQGAQLILTQPVYDTSGLPLIRQIRAEGLKVLVGLMPLVSFRNALFLSNEVPGIRIPADVVARFSPDQSKEAAVETGIQAAVEVAKAFRNDADGFYLIAPFNRADIAVRLLDLIK